MLVIFGATAGFAHAEDLQKHKDDQAASNAAIVQRLDRQEKNDIEERISRLDSEAFNLDTAIRSATRAGRQPDPLHVGRRQAVYAERARLVEQLAVISPQAAAAVRLQ